MAGTLTPVSQTTTSLLADSAASIDAHIADIANPHAVTQTQVGLGNVDNTSDVNKPVSTAQQTALDLKEDEVNKSTSVTTDQASDAKYPSVKSVYDWVVSAFVGKTSLTGSAVIPSGTTAQRDGTPVAGYTRYNSDTTALESWYSAAWNTIVTTANAVLTTGAQSIAGIKTFLDGIEITATKAIDFLGTSGLLKVGGTTVVTLRTDGMAIPAGTADGDAVNLGQLGASASALPYYETGTTTPTPTAAGGSMTATSTIRWSRVGKIVRAEIHVNVSAAGTGAGDINVPIPHTPASISTGCGRERSLTGYQQSVTVLTGTPSAGIRQYDNTTAIATGANIDAVVTYEIA